MTVFFHFVPYNRFMLGLFLPSTSPVLVVLLFGSFFFSRSESVIITVSSRHSHIFLVVQDFSLFASLVVGSALGFHDIGSGASFGTILK